MWTRSSVLVRLWVWVYVDEVLGNYGFTKFTRLL